MWGRMNIIIKPWYEQQVFFNRTDLNRRDVELGSAPNKIPNPNPGDHAKRCFDFKIRKFITKSSSKSCCSFFDPMIYVICSSEFPLMRIENRNINKSIHHRQVLFAMKSILGNPSGQDCHWSVLLGVSLTAALAGLLRGALGLAGGTFKTWKVGLPEVIFFFQATNVGILI